MHTAHRSTQSFSVFQHCMRDFVGAEGVILRARTNLRSSTKGDARKSINETLMDSSGVEGHGGTSISEELLENEENVLNDAQSKSSDWEDFTKSWRSSESREVLSSRRSWTSDRSAGVPAPEGSDRSKCSQLQREDGKWDVGWESIDFTACV
jgi:hypothetical protein